MKKLSVLFMSALLGVACWSCSDDDDKATPVAILSVTVQPDESTVAYTAAVDQTTLEISNAADPVAWDVTDAALAKTTVKAEATLGSQVYYQGTAVPAEGVVVDATAPVTLEAKNADGTVTTTYKLTVVRSTEAGEGSSLVLKASSFVGFPSNLVDYDMVMFNNEFYATVVSLNGDTENYDIYNSIDGVKWNKVDYTCKDAEGKDCVVGGEGARMAVINNKLFILGGARVRGTDKYGNAAEITQGWTGPAPSIPDFRVYSSTDGVSFTDETANITYTSNGNEMPASRLANAYMSIAQNGGKTFLKGGFMASFGMLQGNNLFVSTTDGINYTDIALLPAEIAGFIKYTQNTSFFSFKGKLWSLGGNRSFISASMVVPGIYSSTDGETWAEEGNLPDELAGLISAKVIANDETAILIGGQFVTAEGNTLSNQMYTSTDGKTWTPIETSDKFAPNRNARAVVNGNVAWIFGGYKNVTSGNYGWPDGDGAVLLTDTWAKLF